MWERAIRVPLGVVIDCILGLAAIAAAREALGRRKWGERLLGWARVVVLVTAAVFTIWPRNALWFTASALVVGLVAAGRPLRKLVTITFLRGGAFLARRTDARGVARLARLSQSAIRNIPPLRYRIVRNMQRAGVYSRGLEDQYLARGADQFGMIMQVLSSGFDQSGIKDRFCFGDSLDHLLSAHERGRGVLVLSPHLCGYPVFPRLVAEHVPCSIYLRRSPDPDKHALNVMVGQAGGGHLVFPPAGGSSAERLNVAMNVLRERRALFVTPDLPRKRDEGVPVTIWNRTVYFPPGVMIMAMRTGAAVVLATWFFQDDRYHVHFEAPMLLSRRNRREQAHEAMLAFARTMDDHLRAHPDMWWNWLDKRWTRILRTPAEPQRAQVASAETSHSLPPTPPAGMRASAVEDQLDLESSR
jgi:lauroyl/myristoyl acyltransferase